MYVYAHIHNVCCVCGGHTNMRPIFWSSAHQHIFPPSVFFETQNFQNFLCRSLTVNKLLTTLKHQTAESAVDEKCKSGNLLDWFSCIDMKNPNSFIFLRPDLTH